MQPLFFPLLFFLSVSPLGFFCVATTLSKIRMRHHRHFRWQQHCENDRHGNAALVECGKPFFNPPSFLSPPTLQSPPSLRTLLKLPLGYSCVACSTKTPQYLLTCPTTLQITAICRGSAAKIGFLSPISSIFLWMSLSHQITGEDLCTDQLALLMFKISYCVASHHASRTHTPIYT